MKKIINSKSEFIPGTIYRRGSSIIIERGLLKTRKYWKTYAIHFPRGISKEAIQKYVKEARSVKDKRRKY